LEVSVRTRFHRSGEAAFSLIELIVALAVAAALTLIAMPIYSGITERARVSQAVRDIADISIFLERFRTVSGAYPSSLADLGGNRPTADPWGRPYRYLAIDVVPPPRTGQVRRDKNLNPLNRDFDLYSVGPDGETQTQLTARKARDDIVRAGNGSFIGKAEDH
jgi:general secretion pathway protein G